MRKRTISWLAGLLLLAAVLLPLAAARTVYADPDSSRTDGLGTEQPAVLDHGSCGQSAWWMVFQSGEEQTLYIGGTGALDNVSAFSVPWGAYKNTVTGLVIADGITAVGDYSFYQHRALKTASLPYSLMSVGQYAFSGCSGIGTLNVPGGVKVLGTSAFDTRNTVFFTGTNLEWEEIGGDKSVPGSTVKCAYFLPFDLTKNGRLTLAGAEYTFSGRQLTPEPAVVYGGKRLVRGTDYQVSYKNNFDAGTATVTVKGTGSYTGTLTEQFVIRPYPIADARVTDLKDQTYDGKAKKPVFSVRMTSGTDSFLINEKEDYTVAYSNNTEAGTATVTITGTGNFTGTKKVTFRISPASISGAEITGIEDKVWSGEARSQNPGVKLRLDGRSVTLKKGSDYKLTYKDNTEVGRATVTISGTGNYTGSVSRTFRIQARSIEKAVVSGLRSKAYTGKTIEQNPKLTIKIGDRTVSLKKGTDYTISYSNNKNVGTAKVTFKGTGHYTGTLTKTFEITSVSSTLKFEEQTVSTTKIGSNFTNRLTTSSDGKKTFKSSNSKVASVDSSSGKVTVKGVGKCTISVTVAATKNYKQLTGKYTVIVNKEAEWSDYQLRFSNSSYDFGYDRYYKIPYSRYRTVFGRDADRIYNLYKDLYWGGSCYGMSTTSIMLNNSSSGVKVTQFRSSAKKPKDLRLSDYSSRHDLTFKEFIEAMQISQYSSGYDSAYWKHLQDIDGLVKEVNRTAASGKPVIALIFSSTGGHAVIAYDVTRQSSTESRLRIYDPNFPNDKRYITLYTRNGDYTGWYYKMNDREDWGSSYYRSRISYITYDEFMKMWHGSGTADAANSVATNAASFQILDAAGKVVAEMKDGELTSTSSFIHEFVPVDVVTEDYYVTLPAGDYQLVNTQEELETLTIRTLDSAVTINTGTLGAAAVIGRDASIGAVYMQPLADSGYEVVMESLNLQEDGIEQLAFAGVGSGKMTMLGVEEGQYVYQSGGALTVSINGEVVEEYVPGSSGDNNQDDPVPAGTE